MALTGSLIHPGDLEPALVDPQTYLTRRRTLRIDAAFLLTGMIAFLTLIPARLIIPGTTDVGRPAMVIGLLLFFWWLVARLSPRLAMVGRQPIRWALLGYWLSILVSYATGYMRGLTVIESNSADRWMISTAALSGIILAGADGLANWARLRVVLRAFVWGAAFMSLVGLVEAILGRDITHYLVVPGLVEKGAPPTLQIRGSGLRVASTATHYIELSAMLATAVPFAVHFTRFETSKRARRLFGFASLLIGAGVLVTISRSGVISVLIAGAVLGPLWTWRLRYNVFITCLGVFGVLAAGKPSYARTLVDMFAHLSNDPSITSRTERYGLVGYYFSQRPWLGRGTGTWVHPQYQYLDNQWLATVLCNGILGVVVLAALFITALTLAGIAWRRAVTPEDKHLCAALLSTQIITIFVCATFDAFWFDSYAMTIALTIGLCGAVWRFTHPTRQIRTAVPREGGR